MLKLVKETETDFSFEGDIQYFKHTTKSVVVDGETYYKDSKELVTQNISELLNYYNEYSFKEIDYNIRVKNTNILTGNLSRYLNLEFSQNEDSNIIQNLSYLGLLDSRIKKVFCSTQNKKRGFFEPYNEHFGDQYNNIVFNEMLDHNSVAFHLFNYGFNSSLCYKVSFSDFVYIDYSLLPENMLDYLKRKKILEKKQDPLKNAINLINCKIKRPLCNQ